MSVESLTAIHNAVSSSTATTSSPGATSGMAGLGAAPGVATAGSVPGTSFADALKSAAQNAYSTVSAGEAAAQAGALGQASLHDVVHSVIQAELTVQAVTSIRDKAVQAYQELLRMPV